MSPRTVNCIRLKREAEGLTTPPFPNELGKRVFENVSKEAWKDWLAHSTMLINEYRLQLGTPDANALLLKECEKFFFGEGSERPKEFSPQS